jgi:hypothetical protein
LNHHVPPLLRAQAPNGNVVRNADRGPRSWETFSPGLSSAIGKYGRDGWRTGHEINPGSTGKNGAGGKGM